MQGTRVQSPTLALEISEILFVVYSAYRTVWTVCVLVKGARKLYICAIHWANLRTRLFIRRFSKPIMPDMPVSKLYLSFLVAFSQSVLLVRSRFICTGRGCSYALIAATLCKAPLNVFCKRVLFHSLLSFVLLLILVYVYFSMYTWLWSCLIPIKSLLFLPLATIVIL